MAVSWLRFVLLLAFLPAARAGVLVVGPGGHATGQAAIDAAADGDVILLRVAPGAMTVDAKSLSIVGDTAALLSDSSPVAISNLPAGGLVVLSKLNISIYGSTPPVRVMSCAGAVRLQDLTIQSTMGLVGGAWEPLTCIDASDVAVTRCVIHGADAVNFMFGVPFGVSGVLLSNSTVSFHDCTITGGNGGYAVPSSTGTPQSGADGGSGIAAYGSSLFASNCTIFGGNGGGGMNGGMPPPNCTNTAYTYPTGGGNGGHGVSMDGTSTGSGIANQLAGGNGGAGGFNPCMFQAPSGSAGQSATVHWVESAGTARTVASPPLVREMQSLVLAFHGAPGDRVFLVSTGLPAHIGSPYLGGVFLGLGPYRRLSVGTTDATGALQVALPIGDLGAGVTNEMRHLQCVLLDTSGQPHLGSSVALTPVDSAY